MKIMKFRKVISIFFVLVFLFTNMTTPVYAGGLLDLFGKKTLDYPTEAITYKNGDYLELNWMPVEGAGGYEIIYNGETYKLPAGQNWFDILPSDAEKKNGKMEGSISISTLPNDKKHKQSDRKKYLFSDEISASVNEKSLYGGCKLSKNNLVSWLKSNGYTPNEYTEDGYTIVHVSIKDEKNSGAEAAGTEILEGILVGLIDSVVNNIDNISNYAIENGNGVKDTISKGAEAANEYGKQGAIIGGAKGLSDYFKRDKNKHYMYFYKTGSEKAAPEIMVHIYLASGNPKPNEKLDMNLWDYSEKDDSYYSKTGLYKYKYSIEGDSTDKRWIQTFTRKRIY